MNRRPLPQRRTFSGFTLVELLIVLSIMAAIAIYQANKAKAEVESNLTLAAADNIKSVGAALSLYINTNTGTLSAIENTDVSIGTLQAAGSCGAVTCLPSPFNQLSWSGGYSMRVRRIGAGPTYQYQALACTTNGWVINSQARLDLVGQAIQKVGGPGAMTYDTTNGAYPLGTGAAQGIANYPFSNRAAQLCYFISSATAVMAAMDQVYLRRDGAFPMLGTLPMGGQAIANASTVSATGNITTSGGNVTASAGNLVGTRLQATNDAVIANGVSAGSVTTTGDMTASGNITTAAGTITGGTLTSNGDINVAANGSLQSTGRLNIQSGDTLYLQPFANASGSITRVGGGGGSGNLQVTDMTASNTVTATTDVVIPTLTSRGVPTNTTSVKQLLPRLVEMNTYTVTAHGQVVPAPSCAINGTPQVFILPHVSTGTANGGLWGTSIRMVGSGPWTVEARDAAGCEIGVGACSVPAGNFTALVRTFCSH